MNSPSSPKKSGHTLLEWLTAIGSLLSGLGISVAMYAVVVSVQTLEASTLASIYSMGQEVTRFFAERPEIAPYFYKEDREGISDDELRAQVKQLEPNERRLVKIACELNADFFQVLFVQRKRLPDDDWDTWWSFMCDTYDESPVMQDYLEQRSTWYAFTDAVKDKAGRDKYFIGKRRR
jgi:hypothetical protein